MDVGRKWASVNRMIIETGGKIRALKLVVDI